MAFDPRQLAAQFQGLTLENIGTWPLLPRATVWLVVIIACVIGGKFLLWDQQTQELEQLQTQEQELKNQYRAKLQQAINLDELRRQKELVSQYVLTLEKQLPSKAEMDQLLSDINQAGIGRGLQFELFRPGQTSQKDYYAELPIAVRVSGRYHDLGAFAGDIANLPRIVTLNNINLTAQRDGILALDATAKTYRYLDDQELAAQRKSMAEVRQQIRPIVQQVPEPKEFIPYSYESRTQIDPFDVQKVVMAVSRSQQVRATASTIRPDLERRREVLEGYPLDQIKMVGTMRQNKVDVALLNSGGATHLVRVGNYVGQNFGLVTGISETEVQIKEIVQDAAGEWVERPTKLELQEAARGSK